MSVTLQVQSVIYHNEPHHLLRALDNLANAVRVNREQGGVLGAVTVCYGDASCAPVFSEAEVTQITERFAPFFTFRYRFFQKNTGSALGHNLLGESCESDYMMIMNPDVVLCPTFFAGMLAPFFDPALQAGMTEARQTPIEHPKEFNRTTLETDWATTACAIFPTELFRALEGFDAQTFFLYCDDLDFSWRLRLLGKKIYYRPDCPVYHAKRLSAKAQWQPTSAEVYYSQEAALFMAYKWSNPKRFSALYDAFVAEDSENSRRVIAEFEARKAAGTLPTPLDPTHKVAKFLGDYYTEHRYIL